MKRLLLGVFIIGVLLGACGKPDDVYAALGGGTNVHNHSGAAVGGTSINAASLSRSGLAAYTIVDSASNSHATSYTSSQATFSPTVNALAGDLVVCTYTVEGERNGADFAGLIRLGIFTGTAILESTSIINNPTTRTIEFLGSTVYGAGTIYKSTTVIARVATAGTIAIFGPTATVLYGTAAINQRSHISVHILRSQ